MCGYPGCRRKRRPGTIEGRGSKPKYCDLRDESGSYLHTAATAFRARAAMDRPGGAAPDAPDRPVTTAVTRASHLRTAFLADTQALLDKLTAVVEELRTATDPDNLEAQLETVTAGAAARVASAREDLAREAQLRQEAAAAAEEAVAAAAEMDERLQAAETAQAAAEQARAAAETETRRISQAAAAQVAAAETARDEGITGAQAAAERAITQARAEAAGRVAAAETAASAAAAARIAAAEQATAAAARLNEIRDELTAARREHARELTQVREELAQVRREHADEQARADVAHAAELARLQAAGDRERETLRERVTDLADALQEAREHAARAQRAADDIRLRDETAAPRAASRPRQEKQ